MTENKQALQQRHYLILEKLQSMANTAPLELKQRLSVELLSALSNSLLDGTIFEIVKNLSELQHITERNFFNERNRIANEYGNQRNQLLKRHKATELACEIRPHHLSIVQMANKREMDAFDKRMNEELYRHDLKTLSEMDQKVNEQQEIMQKAGVFGFFQTKDQNEIKLQMLLFQFIQNLSHLMEC